MTIPEIETAWKQAANVWRMNSQRLLSQIPIEDRGTNNRNDQLGDLIARINIQVQNISSQLKTYKAKNEKIIPKKIDESLFNFQ